jgi:regulator of replication initiation timing
MKDLIALVSGIEYKTRQLSSQLRSYEKQIETLEIHNKKLLEENNELKLKSKQLEYTNQIIKIAKALEREKGSTEAKQLINGLLREVDRCIGLMND